MGLIDFLVYRIPWKTRQKIANKLGITIILCMIVPAIRHFVFSIIEAIYYKLVEIYYNHKLKKQQKKN
jgi:hypothetical protein